MGQNVAVQSSYPLLVLDVNDDVDVDDVDDDVHPAYILTQ